MYECVSMHDDVLFFDVVATATATSTRSEFITQQNTKKKQTRYFSSSIGIYIMRECGELENLRIIHMRSDRNGLVNLVHVLANLSVFSSSIFLFNFQFARTNT